MKRIGGIFERVCDRENLFLAWVKVRRGHGNTRAVAAFAANLDAHLAALLRELENNEFRFGAYHFFKVFDPKERTIAAAPVRERVIHHAIINICGERMERALVDQTYACRKGKGQWKAVAAAQAAAQRRAWCLKLDVRHYFDSINHGALLVALERLYKDARLLRLFRDLLASYKAGSDAGVGLPIGNLTSQYFANLYLSPIDRLVTASADVSYIRYMDDMLLFGDRDDLLRLRDEVIGLAGEKLFLEIKHGGSLHRISRGVNFLGCRIFPNATRLSGTSRRRFFHKTQRVENLWTCGKMGELECQQRLTALFAFVKHTDFCHLEKTQGQQPLAPRRQLEQRLVQRPFRLSQQQYAVQQQQQQRLPLSGSPRSPDLQWHDAVNAEPNRVFSCSRREGQTFQSAFPAGQNHAVSAQAVPAAPVLVGSLSGQRDPAGRASAQKSRTPRRENFPNVSDAHSTTSHP